MDELVEKLRRLKMEGWSTAELSKEYKISINKVKRMLAKSYDDVLTRRIAREKADLEMEKLVIEFLPKCNSLNQVCTMLGLRGVEGYYKKIRKIIEKYNLSTAHFGTIQVPATSNSRNQYTALSDEEYFANETHRANHNTIKRLLYRKLKEYKCEVCGISEWNGNPLKLQLHHINGNHNDNRIENLQILCPNCHTQTDNFCGKNKNNNTNVKFLISRKIKEYATKNYCKICGKEITGEGKKYCSHKCAQLGSVQWNVDTEQLLEDFKEIRSFRGVGEKYGVTDNAVKKRCKKLGIYEEIRKYITPRGRYITKKNNQ